MKKLLLIVLLATVLVFSFANFALSAGSSISVSGDSLIYSRALNRPEIRLITVIFTGDGVSGAVPDLTLNAATTGIIHGDVAGWYGYKIIIDCNHGGTEPTENSEIYIYENGFDLLAGGGVDQVDNSAEREVFFNNGTYNIKQPISTTLTVTITQQAVVTNSATGTIYIYFVAE